MKTHTRPSLRSVWSLVRGAPTPSIRFFAGCLTLHMFARKLCIRRGSRRVRFVNDWVYLRLPLTVQQHIRLDV